jgi:putative membrane protein
MYPYLKALHIIFIVTWFAGMFYIVRLFIYNTEAASKPEPESSILSKTIPDHDQEALARHHLAFRYPYTYLRSMGNVNGHWDRTLTDPAGRWLLIKLCFVILLYAYHFSLHSIYKQEMKGIFNYSSQKLRIWNEVATIFLIAIVMLATVKQAMSFVWGLVGLIGFVLILMSAIRIYKTVRKG